MILTTGADAGCGVNGEPTPGHDGATIMAHESCPQGGLGEDDEGPPRDGSDTRAEAVLGVGKLHDEAGAVTWMGSLRVVLPFQPT